MPDETLVKVLSFVLLKPLLVMDKKALRLNSGLVNLIQNILCEVFPENPANFPELENLVLLSKPQTSKKPTPIYNRRDVEVLERVNKTTQADFESLPVFGEESKHMQAAKQNLTTKRTNALVSNRSRPHISSS